MAEVASARVTRKAAEFQAERDMPPSAAVRRKCLLVLGMHRSGTSALSGLLANLGAQRPKRELPPQPDNQRGFFEPSEVVAIHDRFLSGLSSHWFDWRALPEGWRDGRPFQEALNELEAAVRHDFEGDGTFLVKDPRICRFVDLWAAVVKRMKAELVVIHIFRTPIEVASSLRVRNGFNEAQTHLLWLRHVLEAEAATRKLPRAFVSFESLLADGLKEVERVLKFVDVGLAADAGARAAAGTFVDPVFRRQTAAADGSPDNLGRWTASAYSMLQRLTQAPSDRTAKKALDGLRAEFDGGCEAFAPVFAAASARTDEMEQESQRLRTIEEEREVLVRSLRTVSWVADRMPALQTELEIARGRLSEMTAVMRRVDELGREVAAEREMRSGLEAVVVRVPDLERQLAAAHAQVETMEIASQEGAGLLAGIVAERDRLGAELKELVAVRDAELMQTQNTVAALSLMAERVSELEADITAIQVQLDDEQRHHNDTRLLADRLPVLQADCARLKEQLAEAETVAAWVPLLEEALADVQARADLLARQLSSRRELIRRLFFTGA